MLKIFSLVFLLIGQTEEPIKSRDITIYVDERNYTELLLKVSLTQKWIDRINPKLKDDQLFESAKELSKSLDKRTDVLKKYFKFKFVDRTWDNQPFGFSINTSIKIIDLPNSNLMAETGYWLILFEYIEEELNWEERHRLWNIEYTAIKDKFNSKEFEKQDEFLKKKVMENEGWYIAKACGLYDSEGKYWYAVDLGYVSELEMPTYPEEPRKPKSPFENLFILYDKPMNKKD